MLITQRNFTGLIIWNDQVDYFFAVYMHHLPTVTATVPSRVRHFMNGSVHSPDPSSKTFFMTTLVDIAIRSGDVSVSSNKASLAGQTHVRRAEK